MLSLLLNAKIQIINVQTNAISVVFYLLNKFDALRR